MLVVVMYDISDNFVRSNFIKRLRFFGLKRIQKSIFTGILNINERLEIVKEFNSYISSPKDNIILIPVCKKCMDSVFIEGKVSLPKQSNYDFL